MERDGGDDRCVVCRLDKWMGDMANVLDEQSKRFQKEVDDLVRRWATGDEGEYLRRWKQLGNWSMNRTQGDVVKKAALKDRLMEQTGGRCTDCQQPFPAAMLQMHRCDPRYHLDRTVNFGYFPENVVLLCAHCHEVREAVRRQ